MSIRTWFSGVVLGGLFATPVALAGQVQPTWSGQIRPRHEVRDPTPSGVDEFTSMRTRIGLAAVAASGLRVVIEVQDVRLWGEETSTLGDFSADQLDVHQAFVRWTPPGAAWLTATIGRQETSFGGQRLVGAVDWTQQARAFDGARLDFAGARARVAFIGHTLADASSPGHERDARLLGGYATVDEIGPGALDLYVLHDWIDGPAATSRATFGGRWAVGSGPVLGRLEGSLQRGDIAGRDAAAWMLGGRIGVPLQGGRGSVALWYDHLSGDDPDDPDAGAFDTLFATNHKFYGFADLFLNIPRDTGGRGLRDVALKASLGVAEATSLSADLHGFWAARDAGLVSGHFGDEVDLTLRHRVSTGLSVTGGLSFVRQDDALAAVGRLSENMTFGYVMLDARF